MMVTTAGQRVGRQAFTRVVGNGSKLLDVVLDLIMRLRTSAGKRWRSSTLEGRQMGGAYPADLM